MTVKNRKPRPEDVGYGWLVVVAGFMASFVTDGLIFSFGILLVEIIEQFQQSRAATGFIASIATGVMHLVGPLAGALTDLYGCRIVVVIGAIISCVGFILSTLATNVYHLWITYGFLGGLGFGLIYIPANVCVLSNFKEQRTLANGIVVCGSGVGMFVFSQLTRIFIDEYGWRGTILLEGGIVLQGAVIGLFLVRVPPQSNAESNAPLCDEETGNKTLENADEDDRIIQELVLEDCNDNNADLGEYQLKNHDIADCDSNSKPKSKTVKIVIIDICKSMFDKNLLTDVRCVLYLACTFCLNLAFTIPFNLLPDQALESGMHILEASWLSSSIGISNTVSRVFFGWLGDLKCINRLVLSEIVLILTGIVTALSPLLATFETKMIYATLFGIFIGGYITLYGVVIADLFGDEMLSKSFGLVMFTVGVSGFISTPLGGMLFDYTGNYDIPFIVAGAEFLLGCVFLFLCKVCKPKVNQPKITTITVS